MPGHTKSALGGLLVGVSLLTLQHYISTLSPPSPRRTLAAHSLAHPTTTTFANATEWQAIKLGSAVPQGTFKIRSVGNPTQRRHQFLLEIHTQGWLALAISANNTGPDWKNYMTGPPASCAVVGTGMNTVGYIELNGMPPSTPPTPSLLATNGVTNTTLTRLKNERGETITSLSFVASGRLGGHPLLDTINVLYAYGQTDQPDFQYHTPSRRGVLLHVSLANAGDLVVQARIPYYELHGGFLAFIWSVTTLLGGLIARYGRSYHWWIDAHQFLQTVATVLSFPLTLLSYIAKDGSGSHYSSFHGFFGLIFSLTATAQGMLGTYAHAEFAHECGLVSKSPKMMHTCRLVHRTLGKGMLVVATFQILLGLYAYNPNFFNESFSLPWIFALYAGCTWLCIIAIEVRHQRNWAAHRHTQMVPGRVGKRRTSGISFSLADGSG